MATQGSMQTPVGDVEQTTERLARRYVRDVIRDRNLDVLEELFAAPADWESVSLAGGEAADSREELRRYYREELPDFREVTIEKVLADESTAMVRWTATGEVTGALPRLPITGTSFETTAMTEFEFADDRIVGLHVQINEMELLPDVSWPAMQDLVREMRDGVIVLDEDDRIVHVNPAALKLFDREREALLDEPVASLLGEETCQPPAGEREALIDELHGDQTCAIVTTDAGRHVSVGTSPLTGNRGEVLGRIVLLRDVTERRRRIQGLEVQNRVLRHNLRNALQVVQGRLQMARERADEAVASTLAPAQHQVDELLATADTARKVQRALETSEPVRQDVAQIVSSLIDRASQRYPAVDMEVSIPEAAMVEAPAMLDDALWELIDNACEHAADPPNVGVSVEIHGTEAEITVSDNGPGLPRQERRVLETGQETALEHSSGLGLWLARWVIGSADGTLSYEIDDGTTVQVTLPVLSDPQPVHTEAASIAAE